MMKYKGPDFFFPAFFFGIWFLENLWQLLPFRGLGHLLISMARMLSNSMLRFLVIYTVTLFAFSLGATLLTQNVFSKPLDPDYDDEGGVRSKMAEIPSTLFEMIKLFIWVSTGEVVPPGRLLTEARNPGVARTVQASTLVLIIL